MKFRLQRRNIFLRTCLVFASCILLAYGLVHGLYFIMLIGLPVLLFQFVDYYRFHRKAEAEVQQFVESVHYRDFSRYFEVNKAPAELQTFRSGFNQINDTFKLISKEKETQYLHLKTILEIVDTGILSYELESGDVLWMNESLKNLLQIPYLKSISSLGKRNPLLYESIIALGPGSSVVTSIEKNLSRYKVLLAATSFTYDQKVFRLIAFQNINEALDETESRAWQRLLSVMTHEIMNSVAPISSLAETLESNIKQSHIHSPASKESLSDIETGINTIKKRSEGLLKFTEIYRNLSKITTVNKSSMRVMELFEHVQQLLQPTLDKKKIELEIVLRDPWLHIDADHNLIEQVLINLVLNAIDAVKDSANKKIVLLGESETNGRSIIKVRDHGTGISDDLLDQIFVPFFSTKKGGSGIGLSLCKQIMLLHKGSINVQSKAGEGTVFSLIF